MDIRTGQGYDTHIFGDGDHIMLGGVKIPHDRGMIAHSDGDVVLHALTDALYGAIAAGDIGDHFPPSDEKWRGATSHIFLEHAVKLTRDKGYNISNIDATIIAEAPKIGPHRDHIRARIAEIAGLDIGQVSIKATTNEKLGFIGRKEGIAALALATIIKE